jgi:plastocyanin
VTKHLRILAPLLATAALAAGCGGGSSTATSASSDGYSYTTTKQPAAPAKAAATAKPGVAQSTTELAGTKEVAITDFAFQPQTIKAKVGQTVTFVNHDETAHTATAADGSFDSKTLEQGATFVFKPTKAGKISYVCSFHPGMTGTIVVTN